MPDEPAAARHIGMFRVGIETIVALLAPGPHAYHVIDGGIPEDADVLGAYPDDESDALWVVVALDGPPPADADPTGVRVREFRPKMRATPSRIELPEASDN